MSTDRSTWFKGTYLGSTEKAWRIHFDGEDAPRWIPRSDRVVYDITVNLEVGKPVDVEIAEWFVEKEGL